MLLRDVHCGVLPKDGWTVKDMMRSSEVLDQLVDYGRQGVLVWTYIYIGRMIMS